MEPEVIRLEGRLFGLPEISAYWRTDRPESRGVLSFTTVTVVMPAPKLLALILLYAVPAVTLALTRRLTT
jgi:hypothetical protein